MLIIKFSKITFELKVNWNLYIAVEKGKIQWHAWKKMAITIHGFETWKFLAKTMLLSIMLINK